MVELPLCKRVVEGSSPFPSSKDIMVRCQSGQMDQTVNLAARAYEGSNPSLTTNFFSEKVGTEATLRNPTNRRILGAEVPLQVTLRPLRSRGIWPLESFYSSLSRDEIFYRKFRGSSSVVEH